MNPRELIVLSPYRIPAQSSLMLGSEDVATLLNAYSALWHPAALYGAERPPRIESPYDYEQPGAGHVYALPESPPLYLPDDWEQRVIDVGAVSFQATTDRETTLANLKAALARLPLPASEEESPSMPEETARRAQALLELDAPRVAPFLGLGFGFAMIDTLFDAMEHENLLSVVDVWDSVRQAVAALDDPDPEAYRQHLQTAADQLMSAREILYPVNIHIIDLCMLEDRQLDAPLPAAFERGYPINLIAPSAFLERLNQNHPERLQELRERLANEQLDFCGGCYQEREDAVLPLESQLWNLRTGLQVARDLLGSDIRVFARKRFAAHPQLPLLLNRAGIQRAVLLPFDNATLPNFRAVVTNWPSPDGQQVEAFTRAPYAAHDPQTFFHLAYYLKETIMQDHTAALALLHRAEPAAPWYEDWLELNKFGPILGQWTTLTNFFNEVMSGEYATAPSADEFHSDYLEERTTAKVERPISWFPRQLRWRRGIDTIHTLAAIHRGLTGRTKPEQEEERVRFEQRLAELERRIELGDDPGGELAVLQKEVAEPLAQRLLARAKTEEPGFLIVNPCGFARRLALELEEVGPQLVTGPLKGLQIDDGKAKLVVEVPALGFAWIPRSGPPGTPPPVGRMRLADNTYTLRNEFFEAEIDPQTGGLRAIRDQRTRVNRLGQQLIYNPGSQPKISSIEVTSTGPALGEIVVEGALVDDHDAILAKFRQRYRAWLGRPVLDLRIEIFPERPPEGYPWYAYYAARFAWREERALLLRGVNGGSQITSHTRPETPDYLELRQGRQNTVIFPGGLPFHQRQGSRMVDVILVAEGETGQVFDLAIGLDREHPAQTALGIVSPVAVIPTAKGPPHIGATGWLFHLDAPNLALTSLRPAADGADGIVAHLLECSAYSGQAELRCVRNPVRAVVEDFNDQLFMELSVYDDVVMIDTAASDWMQVRVEFS